jgi:hypothetical protein
MSSHSSQRPKMPILGPDGVFAEQGSTIPKFDLESCFPCNQYASVPHYPFG